MKDLFKITRVKIPPIVILVSGLVVISLLTAIGGILHYGSELKDNSQPLVSDTIDKSKELTSNTKNVQNKTNIDKNSVNNDSSNVLNEYSTSASTQTANSQTQNKSTNSGSNISYVEASLSINGVYVGNITLKTPAYQCDVLRQAQARGILTVDMSNKEYGQYVVYVINGLGDKSHQRIEWTYKVNGSLAPLGCQYMPVKNGDSINWEYIN